MSAQAVAGSFRDPNGTVYRIEGTLYREISRDYEPDWSLLHQSGLLDELIEEGMLVRHQEVDRRFGLSANAWKVIRPEAVPFVSYPWEWCFSQLRSAALLTLELQRRALARGLTLKDASAFNVQFRRSRPLFIDTLSFEKHVPGTPWIAYQQFCRHFLAPLLLMSKVDPRLGLLSREHPDGIPLDLAAGVLPWPSRLRPGVALHIHLHAASIRKHQGDRLPDPRMRRRVSPTGLLGLLDNLESVIARLECRVSGTAWWNYEETHGYDPQAMAGKGQLVVELAGQRPGMVWDLGANTGRFAELLATVASSIVAMDADHGAVERHWQRRQEHPEEILPLVMDFTNPTPPGGWALEERESLHDRGPADTILALALIHHLAIGNNVPLGRIAAWLARLGKRIIIEWVPKEDPQVQRLLVARQDIFGDYHEEAFQREFGAVFREVSRRPVPATGRVLYGFEAIRA
jgi:ribosomal protein L11 methylase PrmA